MRHKILVIDDSIDERSEIYERLTTAYTNPNVERPPSFEIELVFAKKPLEVEYLLRHNSFSAVILDVVLKKWLWRPNEPVVASAMLAMIDNSIPVALLSSDWIASEVKNLVAEWPTKNCRMFIHWQDIYDENRIKEGSITRVLFELSKHIGTFRDLDYQLDLEPNAPIRILQLSDLQFGGFDNWKLHLDASHCATTLRKLWPDGPTFIVVTGDIAQRGLPEEYEAAHMWLSELVSAFSWPVPSNRIFLVPGNHDVCLPFATGSLLTLQETETSKKGGAKNPNAKKEYQVDFTPKRELAYDLTDYAYRPYLDFYSRIAQHPYLPLSAHEARRDATRSSFAWVEARFRHLGLVLFGLNTSQPIRPGLLPDRVVPKTTVEYIIKEVQVVSKRCDAPPLIIGLTHHSPLRGSDDLSVEHPEHFDQLFTDVPSVALWLHGHWHKREITTHSTRKDFQLVINSAPSLTVKEKYRPPDTARGFSMIELGREDNNIKSCSIVPVEWTGSVLTIREKEGRSFMRGDNGYFREK